MGLYCDVAVPVPVDRSFTYEVGSELPVVGGRVLVPFSGRRLTGVVLRVHEEAPAEGLEVKPVAAVLDREALLDEAMLGLGRWVADYYVAPLGEVLRGMLPPTAELRQEWVYRIAEQGRRVLYAGAEKGASRRSRLTAEEQDVEYAVLNYLESGEAAKAGTVRSATGARKALLEGMVRKRWLVREALAEERDARRVRRVAVLVEEARLPKLNANQTTVLAELAARGGRVEVRELRESTGASGVPQGTLATLVRRGLVRLEEEEQAMEFGRVGVRAGQEHRLNEAQTEALARVVGAMERGEFTAQLLWGVTGSGKTAVYLRAMERALAMGRGVLLLVPEIGLTPATAGQMFQAFGGEVALLHSALTVDERAQQWHRIRRGEARVVVGTRSAVFAPVRRLGLVIVDEEHDASYKQEETPRYNGRDVAVMRAKEEGAVVVLGSATPSLESWANAERGRYERIEMRERVAGRPLPEVELVDMRTEFREVGRQEIFSRRLLDETRATLERGEQAIVLLNRRGHSVTVVCRSCGERMECENCAIALTYHRQVREDAEATPGERLECHYCGYRTRVPAVCLKCGSEHLYFLGAGSQQGEERLRELFPGARIGRMDRDTVRGRGDMERLLQKLHTGEINLLVGTQMIAKGHDIHNVTMVGVVGADLQLGLPDFRSAERVFQLLTQVAGRAGRGELPGRVLVQTLYPEHYAIRSAQRHDYEGFAAREMQFRRWMHYPPLTALANVVVGSERLEEAAEWAAELGRWFERTRERGVRVMGPVSAPISRLKRSYRFQFVVKAESRRALSAQMHALLAFADGAGVPRRALAVDVDAVRLM